MLKSNPPRWQSRASGLRLQTIVRLRWIAVLGQLVTVVIVRWGLGFEFPLEICLAVIAMSAWLNVFLRIRFAARHHLETWFATALLGYDVVQLSALLYLTGGLENPFAFLVVAPVTVSAATLNPRNTILLGFIAMSSATVLAIYHLPLPWFDGHSFELPLRYKLGIWASVFAGLTFIGFYAHRLATEARQMSDALAATEHVLAREQRLNALDGLAAAAAHELGTPLSTITVVAKELARDVPSDSPLSEDIALIRSQSQRCREILETLTQRLPEGDPLLDHLPLTRMIEEAAEPYKVFDKDIRIIAGPDPDARSHAAVEPVAERKPGVLYGLTNIIENAVDFAAREVVVVAEWNGSTVSITVTDDGPGFAPNVIDSLGEPYLTTRPSAARGGQGGGETSGLGLGFFIAKTLLERSGATIDLANRSEPESGAVVKISWPRAKLEGNDNQDDGIGSRGARGAASPPGHNSLV